MHGNIIHSSFHDLYLGVHSRSARRLDRPEGARRLPVRRRAHGWQVGVAVRHLGLFEGIRFGGLLGGMEG